MTTPAPLQQLLDEAALRRSAERYAQGADMRDKAVWREVLTEDCVIEGPDFHFVGIEECLLPLDMLGTMFRGTQHRVHQQITVIDGDAARGETYGTADHLLNDSDEILSWAIRYQDIWRREANGWRFTHRKLMVDWQEIRAVSPDGTFAG